MYKSLILASAGSDHAGTQSAAAATENVLREHVLAELRPLDESTMQIVCIGAGSTESPSADVIGAKAANLAQVAALGLPVPPAFALPIELCAGILNSDSATRQRLVDGLVEGIKFLEKATDKRFGDRRRPLLVSVRSGAAQSMPGMLDTVLNIGCTPAAVHGLIRLTGDPRFAFDCRCRFLENYGSVVLGRDSSLFKSRLNAMIVAEAAENEQLLDGEALERLAASFQQAIEAEGAVLPEEPMEQLRLAAEAVYRSWLSERAVTYRKLQHLEDLLGTAVTVQTMVFGNSGNSSGSGVAFSRDPSTGASAPVIEIMFGSQGEDVVSGKFTPQTEEAIIRNLPSAAAQLREALTRLEREFGDVQDVEFTIDAGKLWILQTRTAKRSPRAALRFAIDFVKEGRIPPEEALRRLNGIDLTKLTYKRLVVVGPVIGCGIGASTGVGVGRAVFDPERAAHMAANGVPAILIRPDISTMDVAGFAVSEGMITAIGGRTAHAALVARQMDKPCLVGVTNLTVDPQSRCALLPGVTLREGDWLSIDGSAGEIYLGRGKVIADFPEEDMAEVEHWRAGAQ